MQGIAHEAIELKRKLSLEHAQIQANEIAKRFNFK
jgi:hypothetical protein